MAENSKNKKTNKTKTTQEVKLPKYLKLNKGTMWFDITGPNCSNIRLYNTTTTFVGRGYISDEQYDTYRETGYMPSVDVAVDENNNKSTAHGQYGKIHTEDRSYFDTTKIDKSKLANIITAYKNKILVAYDPDKIVEEKRREINKKNFAFKKGSDNGTDGDIIFVGKNKHMFDKLNNSKHDDLINFIKNAPMSAKTNLMDLYDYELQGYNRLNRPRASVLDAIRARLNDLGPGMSSITVEKDTAEAPESYKTKE